MQQKVDTTTNQSTQSEPLTADSYLDELIQLGSHKPLKPSTLEWLSSWRTRAKQAEKQLPFERLMKPYHLSAVEWFCVGVVAYQNITGRRYGTGREDLIDKLLQGGICPASQLRTIFGPQAVLFKEHILEENDGRLVLADKFYQALFGITSQSQPRSTPARKKTPHRVHFPLDLPEKMKQIVIGQDKAIEQMCSAVYEHYLRCQHGQTAGKNNILILGPSGAGKTFLCHTLAKILKVPFVDVNAAQYTESGYMGSDVGDILRALRRKVSDMESNVFPFSIVYIDEIDKLRMQYDASGRDIKGGVQAELLKLIEGTEYICPAKRLDSGRVYDIRNVLFILGGAFVGVEEIIAKRLNAGGMGFVSARTVFSQTALLKHISTEDLVEYGFLPELLGRLSNRIVLNELDENALLRILMEGKNNIISQYKALFKQAGIRLSVPQAVLRTVARKAVENKTGARGLTQVVSSQLSCKLLEMKRTCQKSYTLSVS